VLKKNYFAVVEAFPVCFFLLVFLPSVKSAGGVIEVRPGARYIAFWTK